MEIGEKILKYLSVYGKENKYRLARALKIDVSDLTKALSNLEKEGKIEIKGGRAFLAKGKKPIMKKVRKKRPRVVKEEKEEAEEEKPEEEPEEEKLKTEVSEEGAEEKPEEVLEEPTEEAVRETVVVKTEEEGERIEGTVKFFNPNKGFGFITGDDGKDYYVHESGLKEGVTIKVDDRVSFKAVQGDKGPKAEEVENIS